MFMLVWLGVFTSSLAAQFFVNVNDEIYYKAPEVPLRGFNYTFGGLLPEPALQKKGFGQYSLVASTAACQTILINRGRTDIKLDGLLNFALTQYDSAVQTSQTGQMSLYERVLYSKTTNQPLSPNAALVDMYFGIDGPGNSRINTAMTGATLTPYITSGSFAATGPIDNILYYNEFINQTQFSVQSSFNISVFQATVSFLETMDWLLVGTMYENSIFGFSIQSRVKNYQSKNSTPFFACETFFSDLRQDGLLTQTSENFCTCIASYNTISVIVLFTSLNQAYLWSEYIEKQCNKPGFTYIVASEIAYTPAVVRTKNQTALSNSFLIRSYYNWDFKAFIQECADAADESTTEQILDTYQKYFNFYANCSLGISNAADLPVCAVNRTDYVVPCQCSPETTEATFFGISELFYTTDAVTTIAVALSLLQNNCTFLNEQQSLFKEFVEDIDYCALKTITPRNVNYAMRLVNFTGYTGNIFFSPSIQVRENRDFYVYQLSPALDSTNYIGNYSIYGGNYNMAAIYFPNGQVPVSTNVVQNQSLSDAVVAVFFGVSIALMAIFLLILIYLVRHHNNSVMRKNSAIITEIMCLGAFLHALEIFLNCFGTSDAFCWLDLIFLALGFGLYIGALIVKNYRIYIIFSNRSSTAVRIRTRSLLLWIAAITAFLLLSQLLVLVDGYGAKVKTADGNPFYVYLGCGADSKTLSTIYAIIEEVSRFLILVAACILSFLTRKIRSVYNESVAMAIIAYTYLMSYILLTPLLYLLSNATDSQSLKFLIRAEQLTIVSLIALFVYFLPLCWRIRQHPHTASS